MESTRMRPYDGAMTAPAAQWKLQLTPDPGIAAGTILAPARPEPDLEDGDHDRMTHIVVEGRFGQSVVAATVNRTTVRALCGKEWVPGRDPKRYSLCPTCKEIALAKGWKIPTA